MAEVQRVFIAAGLSDNMRQWLRKARALLEERMPSGCVRWTDPNGIHITVKFLGEIPARRAGEIPAVMDKAAQGLKPFTLAVEGLGCFPTTARPRVIWAGVRREPVLFDLQARLEDDLERIGFPRERRAFSPHLTLGRVKEGVPDSRLAEIGRALETASVESAAGMDVLEICLFKSVLRPGGAEYAVLHRARFSG